MNFCSLLPLFPFLASQKRKESGGESKDEEDGNDSDASSSSQNQENGDTRSNKQRPSRQAAKPKANGKKCLLKSYLVFDSSCSGLSN